MIYSHLLYLNIDFDNIDVIDYMDLNIKLHASNFIHILGKIKGSNIELTSKKDIVIDGIMESLTTF
jgi:hypothetical protein